MLCYKNGSLAREEIRDRYCASSWDTYNQHLENTPPGNNGYSGIYFPLHEIIPPNVQGEFFFKDGTPTDAIPDTHHARAILESQLLSIKRRIISILPENAPPLKRLIVTGGSSANKAICQLAADLFGMSVYVAETKEAAGIGGALLAQFAWWRANHKSDGTFDELKANEGEKLKLVAEPILERTRIYNTLDERYAKYEDIVVKRTSMPAA
jgi:xylulokinase